MMFGGVISNRSWKSDSIIEYGSSDLQAEAHVLAVDDSLIDRKVIEKLLKTTSCKVTAVDSGMRALEFLGIDEEQRTSVVDVMKVDLIITDYCMPGMTGFELLKKIKGSSTFKETPVVIMSSENVIARIDRCLEEGAEEFILKPVQLSDVKRLRDYMSKEDRSDCRESGMNKRKQMEVSDQSTESSPSSRSPPSDSSMSPCSQSPSSISTASSIASLSASPSPLPSMPSSPCEPFDPSSTPSSPSVPLIDSNGSSPSSRPGPSDSPSRRLKMTVEDNVKKYQ